MFYQAECCSFWRWQVAGAIRIRPEKLSGELARVMYNNGASTKQIPRRSLDTGGAYM
jgi:hypothetical protein